MAATIIVERLTGSGPTETDITSTTNRASASDSAAPGSANPVPVPGVGTNYSFWVSTRLKCTVAPSVLVNNLKWYTDGSSGLGTGVALNMNTASSYVEATGVVGTSGDVLNTTNYSSLAGATSDAFTFTSGSPKSVTGSTSGTGLFGHLVVYQFAVGTTASPGLTPSETVTWQYDES